MPGGKGVSQPTLSMWRRAARATVEGMSKELSKEEQKGKP